MSFNPEQVTICTTNMNRNKYLLGALPTWIDRGFKKIVIVDWASQEPIEPLLYMYKGKNITVVRVEGFTQFNCTKSRNLAAEYCDTPYIWFMDGDVKMTYKNEDFIDLKPSIFYHGTVFITGAPTTGSCIMEKKMFDSINGYSEYISTLPGEDLNLYNRLKGQGYKRKFFPLGSLKHIYHPYILRTCYRSWGGLSRAQGTRVAFKLPPWSHDNKQEYIPRNVISLR